MRLNSSFTSQPTGYWRRSSDLSCQTRRRHKVLSFAGKADFHRYSRGGAVGKGKSILSSRMLSPLLVLKQSAHKDRRQVGRRMGRLWRWIRIPLQRHCRQNQRKDQVDSHHSSLQAHRSSYYRADEGSGSENYEQVPLGHVHWQLCNSFFSEWAYLGFSCCVWSLYWLNCCCWRLYHWSVYCPWGLLLRATMKQTNI